jgi:MYXO-CTERM domain-containing protein
MDAGTTADAGATSDARVADAPAADRPALDAGPTIDAAADAGDGLLVDEADPNCSCSAPGRGARPRAPAGLLLAAALAALARRRRR